MNKLKKRFGQHFLHDESVLEQICNAILPTANDTVLEIGPGGGALTKYLIQNVKKLIVIELDRDLIPDLEKMAAMNEVDMSVISADVLKVDFSTLEPDSKLLKVVGNLPYNISTQVMFKCLEHHQRIDQMIFLLQKEVVDRITAPPGSKSYGRLGVMMQYYCQTEKLFEVGAEAFKPPPKVTSAVVRLIPHEKLPYVATSTKDFAQVVRTAFSQRRKTLSNSLKPMLSRTEIESLMIDPRIRPEQLSVEQFVQLSNHVSSNSTEPSLSQ